MSDFDIQTKALAKMNRIMVRWSFDDVVLLGSWCLIDKVPDVKQKTLGVNTKSSPPYISYNPNFICALNDEYLEAVMAKEGFKILLKHCTSRIRDPKHISNLASDITINSKISNTAHDIRIDCNISNLASDITINSNIMGGITDFSDTKTFFSADSFGLEKNRFFEEYYRKLKELADQIQPNIQKALYKSQSLGDEGEGARAGAGGEDNTDSQGFQKFKDQSDALSQHHDPKNSTSNEGWGENNLFDADVQSFVDGEQKNLKNWGRHSNGMLSAIIAANTPEINPKDIVRRFNNTVLTQVSSSSRMKLNRRFGLDSPGKRREYKSRILFAVDTSGSMSENDLARGGSLINATLKHAQVDWVSFDTKIYEVVKNLKKAQQSFDFKGRGGTDFQPIVDFAQEYKYDGVIIFTDGFALAPTRPTKSKVLWLLTSTQYKPPVDWGFQCHLPDEVK